MQYVFESLEEFLFEDLGTLKKFNLPKELLQKIIKSPGASSSGGRESAIEVIDNPTDYQKLLKALKDEFIAGIISVNGDPRVLFYRSSERKFQCYSIHRSREKEEDRRKRDAERKQRELERQRQNESLNEGRSRRGYYNYDPSDMGEMSTQSLSDFIKDLESKEGGVAVELIRRDMDRELKRSERWERRKIEDPLRQPSSEYSRESSPSQLKRYEKFATKQRIKIDKDIEEQREKLKKQIEDNFDKVFDKVIADLRRGYSWNADPKNFSSELIKGIDFSGVQKLAKAYDAVEPGGRDPLSIQKAIKTLKDLGYNK